MQVLHTGLGHSLNPAEAAQTAMSSTPRPTLAIVFAASCFNMQDVYQQVRQQVGEQCAIIGGSTCGEFSSLKATDNGIAIMTLQSSYLSIGIGIGSNMAEDPAAAGRAAGRQAHSHIQANPTVTSMMAVAMCNKKSVEVAKIKPMISLVLPDGMSGGEESFLRSLLKETGRVSQIVGGSTGNDFTRPTTTQFANGVYQNAGVLALLASALKMGTAMGHPYYPTSAGLVVSKASGRTVYELNGQPAVTAMKALLGVDELTDEIFATNPMGVKSSDVFGQYTIKSVMKANPDDSLTFYAEIPENAYLIRMATDRDYAIDSFRKVLSDALQDAGNPKRVGAVIVFNCILRHLLKCRLEFNDLDIFREVLGDDVPMIGFNTFGEQGATLGGSVGHYNQTATVLVIANETITQ